MATTSSTEEVPRSKGTSKTKVLIKFTIRNFYNKFVKEYQKIYSEPFCCNDVMWKIGVQRDKSRNISVLIFCHSCKETSESVVYAEFTLRVRNRVFVQYTRELVGNHEFDVGGKGCGFDNFGALEDMIIKGFLKDDELIVQCIIACGSCIEAEKIDQGSSPTFNHESENTDKTIKLTRMRYFLDSGVGNDCEIILNHDGRDHLIRASKVILARASPVFEAMFFGWCQDSRIHVSDIPLEVFEILISYAYEADWQFRDRSHAVAVYYAADKYLMDELKSLCIKYLWPNKVEAAWAALEFSLKYDLREMRHASVKLIRLHTNEAFLMNDLYNISHETLVFFLKQHDLNSVRELDIFDAVVSWATYKCKKQGLLVCGKNLRAVIGDGMRHIRFLAMLVEDLALSPADTKILTKNEIITLFKRICNASTSVKNNYLSCLRNTRGVKYHHNSYTAA